MITHYLLQYPGFGKGNTSVTHTIVETLRGETSVVAIELHDNTGTSITNGVEAVFDTIVSTLLPMAKFDYYEVYPRGNLTKEIEISIDKVTFNQVLPSAAGPTWTRIPVGDKYFSKNSQIPSALRIISLTTLYTVARSKKLFDPIELNLEFELEECRHHNHPDTCLACFVFLHALFLSMKK